MCDQKQGFFFLATCAGSFRIMTPCFKMWVIKYSAKYSIYLVFARSKRCAFHYTWPNVLLGKYRKLSAVWLFFFNLLVASLRFSLVYLCVQFVFSAAVLHFLVRWIKVVKSLFGLNAFIDPPCTSFVRTILKLDHIFFRSLANEGLFFYNDNGILYAWK